MTSKLQTKLEALEQSYVCAADCGDFEACEILTRKIGLVERELSKDYVRRIEEGLRGDA